MSIHGFALIVEGDPNVYLSDDASPTSFSDGYPEGAVFRRGALRVPELITERLIPTEGNVEVSALDFELHDPDGRLTALWTLDESLVGSTPLVGDVLTGDTTLTVRDSSAIGSLPRFVWLAGEAMEATAAPTSTTITVVRARLGTIARAITATGQSFEVTNNPRDMKGRRVRFYRRTSATGYSLRWVGYVRQGPLVSSNGASWMVACVHAWDQEGASVLAVQDSAATLSKYDAQCIRVNITTDDRAVSPSSRYPNYKAMAFDTLADAMNRAVRAVVDDLARLGATRPFGSVTQRGDGSFVVTVKYEGLSLGSAELTIGDEAFAASSADASGYREHVWIIPNVDGGALVRAGFALGGEQRATVCMPHVGLRSTNWAPVVGSVAGVVMTPVLFGELSKDSFIEFDPTSHSPAGPVSNDTAYTEQGTDPATGVHTFRGFARILPRDPTTTTPDFHTFRSYRAGLPIASALPLYVGLKVSAPHWLDAVQSVLEDQSFATSGSDERNWSWSFAAITKRRTGGEAAAVELRFMGEQNVKDTLTELCKLRGGCVAVRDGALTIVSVEEPRASDTPAATIASSDIVAKDLPMWSENDEGIITAATITTPQRPITVRDRVSVARFGQQRTLDINALGLQRDARWLADPVGAALATVARVLRRWSQPVYRYTFTVPASKYERVQLGDVVSLEAFNLPNRRGGVGSTPVSLVVVSRTENLRSNTLTLEGLSFPVAYGFAPAARVSSITGAVLTLASSYAGNAGDYAGSSLVGYQRTANDRGAGWFAAGDKVRLVLGDTATFTAESFTVSSVDTATGKITLTASVPTSPNNWAALASSGIVYVTFDTWASSLASQRIFAATADEGTRTIGGTASRALKWSS